MVSGYLKGGVTLRELGRKHGIGTTTIHRWVKEYEAAEGPRGVGGEAEDTAGKKAWRGLVAKDAGLTAEVRRLRRELEETRLHNRLLNAMIDIAEEQFEIPIRKKRGAKQ